MRSMKGESSSSSSPRASATRIAGRGCRRHPCGARSPGRHHAVDQYRLQSGREADPAAGARAGCDGADAPGAGRGRRDAQGPRGRRRRRCRPRGRSRSSTCSSIGRWPDRSASPSARWRRRCGPRLPGIDVGDWIDPSGETRDVTIRLAPESRTVVADLESLPLLVGSDNDEHSARTGGARDAIDRAGSHRSPRSRSRDHRRGQYREPCAVGGGRRHDGARASSPSPSRRDTR